MALRGDVRAPRLRDLTRRDLLQAQRDFEARQAQEQAPKRLERRSALAEDALHAELEWLQKEVS